MDSIVTYEHHDGIATITIDDGKANVMSVRMLQALTAALDRAQADQAVVVLAGRSGSMFSGGFPHSLRIDPELREAAESVLREGETLTSLIETAVRETVRRRRAQEEFLARSALERRRQTHRRLPRRG